MIGARESRALRKLQRGQSIAASTMSSPYVFVSERGSPLSIAGYQRMVARAGEAAGFGFLIHSHMCGIAAATSLPMMATTRGPSSISSAIAQSRARCATRRWRRPVQGVLEGLMLDPFRLPNGLGSGPRGYAPSLGGKGGSKPVPSTGTSLTPKAARRLQGVPNL